MTDVSIIIVNWNTKQLLLDCIQSLLEETRELSMEIIVVDNHSSDGSPDAVRKRFPPVKVIENMENFGFAKANNIGIRQSAGRYVCLVNTDIVALDRCVDRMVEYMDRHREIGALGPKTVDENGRIRRNCREFPSLRNTFVEALFLNRLFPRSRLFRGRVLFDFAFDTTREVDVLSGCFLMVRREALEEVGLMDEAFFFYGEDVDWGRRFQRAGWKSVLYHEAEAVHLGGGTSKRSSLRFAMEQQKANYLYWRKHKSLLAQKLYLLNMTVHYALRAALWACMYLARRSNRGFSLSKLRESLLKCRWHLIPPGGRKYF